jgi:hypothetical protein
VSLSSGDEVPHIFTRKSRIRPGQFLITSAKRLLQQYLPLAVMPFRQAGRSFRPFDSQKRAFLGSIAKWRMIQLDSN